jgi:quinol monooxygenase YgiN
MSFHFFVHFEPKPGREAEFRDALECVIIPSRKEAGNIALNVFESLREPRTFTIHSEWTDEAAFDLHVSLPHTVLFLHQCKELLTHEFAGSKTREIF